MAGQAHGDHTASTESIYHPNNTVRFCCSPGIHLHLEPDMFNMAWNNRPIAVGNMQRSISRFTKYLKHAKYLIHAMFEAPDVSMQAWVVPQCEQCIPP